MQMESQEISPEEVLRMINAWAEQKYFESGKVPTLPEVEKAWLIAFPIIQNHRNSIRQDLSELRNSTDNMSPKSFIIAQMELSTADRRSIRTKLKSIGVSVQEYEKIKRNPKFMEYMRTEAKRRFGDADISADISLIKNVEDGDLNSIRYFNELAGRAPNVETVNVAKVLATVMEILVSYVDPLTLTKVAHELESRVVGNLIESYEVQETRGIQEDAHSNNFSLQLKVGT